MLKFARGLRTLALLLPCLAGWAGQASAQAVTGTATYRERLALPPDALFEAILEDVSRADAPAEEIGRARVQRPGNPPIRFEIAYDPSRIDPRRRYAVRARILVGGRQFFVSDTSHPVLTAGRGGEVEILLRRTGAAGAAPGGGGAPGDLPATFAGDLPCADCPGIRHQLELFPDDAFFLRRTYLGKGEGAAFDDIGSWTAAGDGRTLTLFGAGETPQRLAIVNANTLRFLDREGREIASPHNYELTRTGDLPPLEPRLALRGTYRYFADAGRLTECLTGKSWPVAQEQDNAALEAAYSRTRREPGEELLVSLDGRVAMRPRMEGAGQQAALVVERFVGVWPGESCGSRYSTEPLENTYWKLTRLGDAPVAVAPQQREAHLVLNPQTRRVQGSGGCNRLMGGYALDGDRLAFGQMAGTMMACPQGMDTERAFLETLQRAARFKIVRQHLELFDGSGGMVARFEARHMR